MVYKKRTHTCGQLRSSDAGKSVTLNGWVDAQRDLGGVLFLLLRDRYGKTQIVVDPRRDREIYDRAKELRNEYVVSVSGKVDRRPSGMENPAMPTGEIDVAATELTLLAASETTPFPIDDELEVNEETRLKYRYLDLRRPSLQKNLAVRHRMYQIARKYFDELGFLEVETPVLMKSTPEGARDYLVPSRVHPGKFYALPQSPQTYKQILMVAGIDRYFQIVKCFRDEDLRADRQPEFTQIDVEMSFIDEPEIQRVAEDLMTRFFKEVKGKEIPGPFPRLTYQEAISRYGSDKPDTRFTLTLADLSPVLANSAFRVFTEAIANGGVVAGLAAPGAASYSRSQLDSLTDFARSLGAAGLTWIKMAESGPESTIEKFTGKEALGTIARALAAKTGDLILMVSGARALVYSVLGSLRLEMGRRLKLIDESSYGLLWVTEFPMFEYDPGEKRFVAVHHPFTSPLQEDLPLLESDPLRVRARAYDLVLNGNEIAGGSIRIHDRGLQSKIFSLLGIDSESARRKFGFMLEAFRYGAPPHGGIAFGFDRICTLLTGGKSIRDVIAFPKTTSAMSLMDDSPSEVDRRQLDELHLRPL